MGAQGAAGSTRIMMERLKNWLKDRISAGDPAPPRDLRVTGSFQAAPDKPVKNSRRSNPESVEVDSSLHNAVESQGPDKNVLIRNRYVREETGTHETLKILDDSMVETGEEPGIDPYNTGGFDRSRKWDQRFRK